MSVKSGRGIYPGLGRLQLVRPYRVIHLVAGIVYLALFLAVYRTYLSVEWGYTGLLYRPLGAGELVFVVAAVAAASLAMPQRIATPSSIIVWMLYAFIFVPTLAITFMIGDRSALAYIPSLAAMLVVLMCAASMAERNARRMIGGALPDTQMILIMTAVFAGSALLLYNTFGSIMSFSSIDDVYYQRFKSSEIGGGSIGYLRTHFSFLFSTMLIATGLLKRNHFYLLILGVFGYIIIYMIEASKISLIVPFVMIGLYLLTKLSTFRSYYLTFGVSIASAVAFLLTSQFSIVKILADLVLFRSIAIPAQTFAQYSDLFAARGHTYWSNVRGINIFVAPPAGFASDPYWPVLGQIVGVEYYGVGSQMNANANLFAGEGVAAAGSVGVLVVGAALIVWLQMLDRAAERWNPTFATLLAVPLGLGLANTHLSTLLLSFGGAALWIILRYYPITGTARR